MGDCTIILKDTPDDIYIAHNTHNVFSIVQRLFKSTKIEWDTYSSFMQSETMRLSARYGAIGSKDDFYVLDSGLVVMETSILIFNDSLYDQIEVRALPYFIRVTVANWMAKDNLHWIDTYLKYDSGTHVAQWIIVDTNKSKYSDNSINLLDSIMGDHQAFDISQKFKDQGYWAGYNVAYSHRIWETCKYDPDKHSFTNDERAVIIKEKIGNVNTFDDLKHLIRLNENSTYPCGSIAPRCDLDPRPEERRPFGAIDGKMTKASWIKARNLTIIGINSPTFDNPDLPPFSFTGEWEMVPHRETPTVYNFTWQNVFEYVDSPTTISE